MTEYRNSPSIRSRIHREPLRVGSVARICRVTHKTILNWINQGALRSYTTAGGHNRIWPSDLRAFLDKTGLDVEFAFEDNRQTRILIVDNKPCHRQLLLESFRDRFSHASVDAARNEYEALLLVGEHKPHVVAWDLTMPRVDALQLVELLKWRGRYAPIQIVLGHHPGPEELNWRVHAGGVVQQEQMGAGLDELLNYLQAQLTAAILPSKRESAPAAPQVVLHLPGMPSGIRGLQRESARFPSAVSGSSFQQE
jgi:CheY-like chemotaxis protein